MTEERFFGQNISEAIKVIKGWFQEEKVSILNCPFCNSELKPTDTMNRIIKNENGSEHHFEYYVECPNCKCNGPSGKNYTEALELWNNREELI